MTKLVRWEPMDVFSEVNRMMDMPRLNWLTERGESSGRGWSLEIDVTENDNVYTVEASVPGIDPDDLEITLENDVLTISGEMKQDETREGDNYHIRERRYGSFRRSLRFPVDVNADEIDANIENGVLTLHVPKAEKTEAKRITVNAS